MKDYCGLFPFATMMIKVDDFKIEYINKRFKEYFDIKNDIVGIKVDLIPFMELLLEGIKEAYVKQEEIQYQNIKISGENKYDVVIDSNKKHIQLFIIKVKEQIKNKRTWNKNFFEESPNFVIQVNNEENIENISKTAVHFLGEDYTKKNLRNIRYFYKKANIKQLNGEELKFEDTVLFKILNNEKEAEKEILTCKCQKLYIKMRSYPLYNSDKKLIGAIVTLKNINEQYRKTKVGEDKRQKLLQFSAELKAKCDVIEILREKEKQHLAHLKNVINNISEGLIVLDKDGNFSFCNKSAYNITEFDSGQIMDFFKVKNVTTNCENSNELVSKYYENIKKGIAVKNFVLRFNNKKQYVEFNSTPVLKGEKIQNTIITLKDITEIKIHQIRVEEQSQFIRQVVNTIDIPIAVINYPQKKCKLINKKFENIISENGNENYDECLLKYKNTKLYDAFKICGEQGKERTVPSYFLQDEEENIRIHRIKFIPYKNKVGKVNLIYIHGVDITDEIKHNKELEKINKMKNEFFTVTSHELRTPLTIIYSSIQLTYDIYKSEITPNMDKTLKRINQNCKRLLKLVNNILDLSKAEAGFLDVNLTTNDIVQVTEFITDSVNSYAQSKKIKVIFDTNEEESLVAIDKEKYEKILFNLLSNAIKFTPSQKNIFVTLNISKDKFKLFVRDEGIGIPDSKIKYIFDRFTQVDKSLTRRAEGTGIGLSLVKKLVQLMNGTIEVKSQENCGTEFIVTFNRMKNKVENKNCHEILDENVDKKINIEFSDIG